MGLLRNVLEVLENHGPMAPGDVVGVLGAPRYRVLAAFHCLEELGLVVALYKKGTYKIYQISSLGRAILQAAEEQGGLARVLEDALSGARHAPGEGVGVEA